MLAARPSILGPWAGVSLTVSSEFKLAECLPEREWIVRPGGHIKSAFSGVYTGSSSGVWRCWSARPSKLVMEGHARRYLQTMTKAELHRLVEALPDESLPAAAILLRRAQDPVVAKRDAAPLDDEDLTDEDRSSRSPGQSGIACSEVEAELSAG